MASTTVLPETILGELFERIPSPKWRTEKLKPGAKRCRICFVVKDGSEFRRNRARCRVCSNRVAREQHRERLASDPGLSYRIALKSRMSLYGLTPERFEQMMTDQGAQCRICRKELSAEGRGTHVDHCHDTGRVRSLLCQTCNHVVGLLEKVRLAGSIFDKYIEEHRPSTAAKAS